MGWKTAILQQDWIFLRCVAPQIPTALDEATLYGNRFLFLVTQGHFYFAARPACPCRAAAPAFGARLNFRGSSIVEPLFDMAVAGFLDVMHVYGICSLCCD